MSSRQSPRLPLALSGVSTMPWIIAIVAVIGCIGLAAWTTSLRSDLRDANARVAEVAAERDQLRQAATASVFELSPTAQGPSNASGAMYLRAGGSGVLNVVNLPQIEDDEVYQVWFLPPDEGEPIPGGTFDVDDRGIGFLLISADTGSFQGVSVSIEPVGGSETATSPMLLSGAGDGARG